jgi:hypothetical protein
MADPQMIDPVERLGFVLCLAAALVMLCVPQGAVDTGIPADTAEPTVVTCSRRQCCSWRGKWLVGCDSPLEDEMPTYVNERQRDLFRGAGDPVNRAAAVAEGLDWIESHAAARPGITRAEAARLPEPERQGQLVRVTRIDGLTVEREPHGSEWVITRGPGGGSDYLVRKAGLPTRYPDALTARQRLDAGVPVDGQAEPRTIPAGGSGR